MKPTPALCGKLSVDACADFQSAGWLSFVSLGRFRGMSKAHASLSPESTFC
jgi:hypothetical protein